MANKKSGEETKEGRENELEENDSCQEAGEPEAGKEIGKKEEACREEKAHFEKGRREGWRSCPKRAATAKTAKVHAMVQKNRAPARRRRFDDEPYEVQGLISGATTQSGDTQALSNVESADSESVDELVEEGNAFEADAIAGVERAGDRPEREVRTREVPEDDVPEEYLDQD